MKRDLCIMACVFCRDPKFFEWMQELDGKGSVFVEKDAKTFILVACNVTSRNFLDTDTEAAERFHEYVRKPFLAWKEAHP